MACLRVTINGERFLAIQAAPFSSDKITHHVVIYIDLIDVNCYRNNLIFLADMEKGVNCMDFNLILLIVIAIELALIYIKMGKK